MSEKQILKLNYLISLQTAFTQVTRESRNLNEGPLMSDFPLRLIVTPDDDGITVTYVWYTT